MKMSYVSYAGLSLEVTGEYVPRSSGGRDTPPEDSQIEEMVVMLEGHDITDIISRKAFDEIEALVLEDLEQ